MKTQLLLWIGFMLKLILTEATENTTANEEDEIALGLRSGILSNIVEELEKPLNYLLPPKTKKVVDGIVSPIKKVADKIESEFKPIFPGTQWCGSGNRARSNEDLGLFRITDDCCREHDNCPDNIPAQGSRHGLNNTGPFTRSNCVCDEKFYDCLKEAHTLISTKIGIAYFNILRPKCFREDFPVTGCETYEGIVFKRCTKYKIDSSKSKIWQWFDAKEF